MRFFQQPLDTVSGNANCVEVRQSPEELISSLLMYFCGNCSTEMILSGIFEGVFVLIDRCPRLSMVVAACSSTQVHPVAQI